MLLIVNASDSAAPSITTLLRSFSLRLSVLASPLLALGMLSCTALLLPTAEQVPTSVRVVPAEIHLRDQETTELAVQILDAHGEEIREVPSAVRPSLGVSNPELAYKDKPAGGLIPPNSTLVFDVELIEISP